MKGILFKGAERSKLGERGRRRRKYSQSNTTAQAEFQPFRYEERGYEMKFKRWEGDSHWGLKTNITLVVTMAMVSASARARRQRHYYQIGNLLYLRRFFRTKTFVISLICIALLPPLFFHFKLRRFDQVTIFNQIT